MAHLLLPLLFQVQSEFQPKHGAKAKTAGEKGLDRQFGGRLKYHMEYCINNPGEISKIHRVKAKVDEVKGIMVQNIEKVCFGGACVSTHVQAIATPPSNVRNSLRARDFEA